MKRYKCKKCGIVSTHKKSCFLCGCKDKEVINIPKPKRSRFSGRILHIGI